MCPVSEMWRRGKEEGTYVFESVEEGTEESVTLVQVSLVACLFRPASSVDTGSDTGTEETSRGVPVAILIRDVVLNPPVKSVGRLPLVHGVFLTFMPVRGSISSSRGSIGPLNLGSTFLASPPGKSLAYP
jgi:hypothetical protein